MDKELALAIDFKKAPVELQNAATNHYANTKAVAKLKKQLAAVANDLTMAEGKAEDSRKALREALTKWDPEATA